jgi:hypothetical protein
MILTAWIVSSSGGPVLGAGPALGVDGCSNKNFVHGGCEMALEKGPALMLFYIYGFV